MLIVLDFILLISKSAAKIQQIPETEVLFQELILFFDIILVETAYICTFIIM